MYSQVHVTQVTAGQKKRILIWPLNRMKEEDEEELEKCLVGEQEWEQGVALNPGLLQLYHYCQTTSLDT